MNTSIPDDIHLIVLQNIESAIMNIYNTETNFIDFDVLNAVEVLISYYVALIRCKEPKPNYLTGVQRIVFEDVKKSIDENILTIKPENPNDPKPFNNELVVDCLKKIRVSIKFWTKERGRQGYLDYVSDFF